MSSMLEPFNIIKEYDFLFTIAFSAIAAVFAAMSYFQAKRNDKENKEPSSFLRIESGTFDHSDKNFFCTVIVYISRLHLIYRIGQWPLMV